MSNFKAKFNLQDRMTQYRKTKFTPDQHTTHT